VSIETRTVLICDNCEDEVEMDSDKSRIPKGWKKDYNSERYQSIFGHLCPDCLSTIEDEL
jgi:hypothetical protein